MSISVTQTTAGEVSDGDGGGGGDARLSFGARLGRSFARLVGVFFSPVTTFRSIGQSPDWLVPIVVVLGASLAVTLLMAPHLDVVSMMEAQASASSASPAQIEAQISAAREHPEFIIAAIIGFGWFGGWVLALFALTLLFWGGSNAFGGKLTYGKTLSVTAYAWMIPLLHVAVLYTALLARGEPVRPDLIPMILPTSGAAFMAAADASTWLFSLATQVNLFAVWGLAVLGIGLSEAGRFSRGSALTLVGLLWGVWIVISVGLILLRG